MKVNRRQYFKKAAQATAVAAGVGAFPAIAKRRKRSRLIMAIPKTLPIWGSGVERFAKQVKTMSGGELDIRVYGAGEIVPALEVFSAVKAGRAQMGHAASYYWQGMMPAAPFFTAVPFGLNARGMRSWIKYGGGQSLWDELYKPHGVFSMPAGNTGLQMGGWFRKEIKSIKDFKGLKMRIPGLGGKVLEKVGGKPMLVAGGEIFTSLSTGVIDATEWVGPTHDYTMGFQKAASYYYHPGWHEPGPLLELIINKKWWDSLGKELQEIMTVAASALDADMYSEWIAEDAKFFDKIKKDKKVKIRSFPEEVLAELKKNADIVKSEVAKTSPLAKKIFDSHQNFQELFLSHQKATEWEYTNSLIR